MKNLKFFTLLATLKDTEIQSFDRYLSALYPGEKTAIGVFRHVRKFYPEFCDPVRLEMAYLHRKIFQHPMPSNPDERRKAEKNLLNTFSDLHRWLKAFLLTEKANSVSLESRLMWLGILHERGLKVECTRQTSRAYAEILSGAKRNIRNYWEALAICNFQYQALSSANHHPELPEMLECLQVLEALADTIKRKAACYLSNMKKVRPSKSVSTDRMPAAPFSDVPLENQFPLVPIYRDIQQLLTDDQPALYDRVEQQLFQHVGALDTDELHEVLSYLHNYAAGQIRGKDRGAYSERLHRLNKFGLQYGFFHRQGMSSTQFTNVVNIACSMQDLEWALSFVQEQSGLLVDSVRRDTVVLAEAVIFFEQKAYDKVLSRLVAREFPSVYDAIRSRLLVLRSYIELQEDRDRVIDYCAAFEQMLRRKRKPHKEAVEAALKFVQIVRLLLIERIDAQTLLQKIDSAAHLHYRPWLREQVAQYQTRHTASSRS